MSLMNNKRASQDDEPGVKHTRLRALSCTEENESKDDGSSSSDDDEHATIFEHAIFHFKKHGGLVRFGGIRALYTGRFIARLRVPEDIIKEHLIPKANSFWYKPFATQAKSNLSLCPASRTSVMLCERGGDKNNGLILTVDSAGVFHQVAGVDFKHLRTDPCVVPEALLALCKYWPTINDREPDKYDSTHFDSWSGLVVFVDANTTQDEIERRFWIAMFSCVFSCRWSSRNLKGFEFMHM